MKIYSVKDVGWNGEISSVKLNGEIIFSPSKARELGFIAETREYEILTIEYLKDENLPEAVKMMPDYQCWDSDKKRLSKKSP